MPLVVPHPPEVKNHASYIVVHPAAANLWRAELVQFILPLLSVEDGGPRFEDATEGELYKQVTSKGEAALRRSMKRLGRGIPTYAVYFRTESVQLVEQAAAKEEAKEEGQEKEDKKGKDGKKAKEEGQEKEDKKGKDGKE